VTSGRGTAAGTGIDRGGSVLSCSERETNAGNRGATRELCPARIYRSGSAL